MRLWKARCRAEQAEPAEELFSKTFEIAVQCRRPGIDWALRERQPCRCLARQKSDAPSMQPVAADKNPMEKKTVACSLHVITCLLSQIKTGSVLQISTTFSTSFNCFVDQTYGNLNGLLSIITTKPLIFRSVPQMAVLTVLDLYQEQNHDHSNV